jgi:hypothetical protein
LLETEFFLPLLKWKNVDADVADDQIKKVVDITNTDCFKKHMSEMEALVQGEKYSDCEKINLLISFAFDGAQVHHHRTTQFWSLSISFLNLPPSHRNVYDVGMFVLAILSFSPGMFAIF